MKIYKGSELVSRSYFSYNFWWKCFFCNITQTGEMPFWECVYFPNCSIKCVSCFMLGQLMTSWDLNIWKVEIDYFKIGKSFQSKIKTFFLVLQVLSCRLKNNKNLTDTTFKYLAYYMKQNCEIWWQYLILVFHSARLLLCHKFMNKRKLTVD